MLSFWEQFAVAIFQGILTGLHLTPTNIPVLGKVLIPIRDTLNLLYPPTPTTTTTTP